MLNLRQRQTRAASSEAAQIQQSACSSLKLCSQSYCVPLRSYPADSTPRLQTKFRPTLLDRKDHFHLRHPFASIVELVVFYSSRPPTLPILLFSDSSTHTHTHTDIPSPSPSLHTHTLTHIYPYSSTSLSTHQRRRHSFPHEYPRNIG